MKNVLITGASSFTGKYLIERIYDPTKYIIHGLSTSINNISEINYRIVDITNKKNVEEYISEIKPDVVIHLAGISNPRHINELEMINVNVIGTNNIINSLNKMNWKGRFIYSSTSHVYGKQIKLPISEDARINCSELYSVSKYAGEKLISKLKNKNNIIVRPFNYTGRGQCENFLIPKIINAFKRRDKEIELGNIEILRDFSDVRDVVKIYEYLINTNDTGILNIGSGNPILIKDIIKFCQIKTNVDIKIKSNKLINDNIEIIYANIDKLKKSYNKNRIDIFDTIEWMLKD